MSDDLHDAIETVAQLRGQGLTAAEIIASVGEPMPKGQIGNDDAIDAVINAWARLQRPAMWEAA